MSPTIGLFIATVTLLNIAGALWLLWWTRKKRGDEPQAETTGHVWDEDLREYNNPLPRWWLWLFIITVIFGLGYLALYPGLGSYKGARNWTQIEQYRAQSGEAEAQLAKTFAPFESATVPALVYDPKALTVGRNLFLNNCATCHGSDGRGAPGFPNLADQDWLWGGDPDRVLESIRNGRQSAMPAWGEVLGSTDVENVMAYVLTLSGRTLPAGDAAIGQEKFRQICAACHGADGRGNPALGAPNLTDRIWLNGGSLAAIRETISKGRQGVMPAHLARLGPVRTKLLAAYVLSLGGAPAP